MYPFPQDEAQGDGIPVTVVFRRHKWLIGDEGGPIKGDGRVFALFPFMGNIPDPSGGIEVQCPSYEHVGQHSDAHYFHCIENSMPINVKNKKDLADQTALFNELVDREYDMNVMTHEEVMQEVGYKAGVKDCQ